jgi:hypothetical protein
MEAAGTKIPPLPVTYIDAKDHAEAVKLLIKLNERFGTITEAGFKEFADYEGLDIEDVELPNISNIEDLLYADEEISEAFENIKSMTSNVATQTEPHTQQEPFIAYCQGCGAFVEVPREKLEEIVNVN